MTNMTLALPEDLHQTMKRHPEIRWSEVARAALREQARKLELMESLVANSKLTEKDAKEIGESIKKAIARRHGITIKD